MYSVVIIDDGSTLKNIFMEMYKVLKIHYWCLSRGNLRGNSVEHYNLLLNKTQTIYDNDIGTNACYIDNASTSQYAWNGAPIENTDVLCSLATVGREYAM